MKAALPRDRSSSVSSAGVTSVAGHPPHPTAARCLELVSVSQADENSVTIGSFATCCVLFVCVTSYPSRASYHGQDPSWADVGVIYHIMGRCGGHLGKKPSKNGGNPRRAKPPESRCLPSLV